MSEGILGQLTKDLKEQFPFALQLDEGCNEAQFIVFVRYASKKDKLY